MTKRLSIPLSLAAAALLAACADGPTTSAVTPGEGTVPLLSAAPHAEVIPGRYIVVFRDDVEDPAGLATRLVSAHGGKLHYTYRYTIKGFAATLPGTAVEGLRRNPHVAYIQPDQVARPTAVQTPLPSWGLDRIDQRYLPRNDTFTYNFTGSGVRAYVIDSGIDTTHPQFGGRATLGYDACYAEECYDGDQYGHGTWVAGVLGSTSHGVAKGVSLVSVRVYRYYEPGRTILATASSLAQGVDWVTRQKQEFATVPMVANVSSRVAADVALDDAVRRSIAAGVTYVVGAGNDTANACNYSPARVAEAITVGATDRFDNMSIFSNHGPCVDLYAPGQGINTTTVGGGVSSQGVSGTSMSAPHVAGFAAMYLQRYPASSPSSVHSAVIYYSTKNVVQNLGSSSYNRLLFTNYDEGLSGRPPGCCR